MKMLRVFVWGLFLFCISSQAFAYDLTDPGGEDIWSGIDHTLPEPYRTITNEASAFISGDTLCLYTAGSPDFAVGDTIEISLSGGASFADSAYTLELSAGGAGTGDLSYAILQTASPAGRSSISFLLQESTTPPTMWGPQLLSDSIIFIVSGHATVAAQPVTINLPQIDGLDIYITFTVRDLAGNLKGSIQHMLYDNTLPPAPTDPENRAAIRNILSMHIRNITSQNVGLSSLLKGNGFGNSQVSSLLGEYAPLGEVLLASATHSSQRSLPAFMELQNSQGRFATSLNQINDWSQNPAVRFQGDSPKYSEQKSPLNVWLKGRWQNSSDSRGGTKGNSDFGLFMTGMDYRFNQDTIAGVLAQYDSYKSTATGQNSKGKGWGWTFGPYLVTRLGDDLIWDARIAWGQSKNKINTLNQGWDDFDGERWQVETNLTGDMKYQEWNIFPRLGLNYFEEKQKAYTSINKISVEKQTVALGNLSFGPEVSRLFQKSDNISFRPFLAIIGLWEFKSPDIIHINGAAVSTEEVRAKSELGGEATFKNGERVYVKYTFDGIGLSGYESHSLELAGSSPFNFGFLPDKSNVNVVYSLCDNGINKGNVSLEVVF